MSILDGIITPVTMNPFNNFLDISRNNFENISDISDEQIQFVIYYMTFCNVALSAYQWNIPDEYEQINADFIERLLHYKGRAAVINDKTRGLLVADFTTKQSNINFLGFPKEITAVDVFNNNEVIGNYSTGDFVIIKNNAMLLPTNLICLKFAQQITQIIQAMDVNTANQKFPIVLQGTREQKTSLEALIKNIDNNFQYVFIDKELNVEDIKNLNVAPPFIAEKLYNILNQKKNELLTLIGINNVNIEKNSGVSDTEVMSNNDIVSRIAYTYLSEREKACKQIEKLFNISVSVEATKATNGNTDVFESGVDDE